jgi:hypothetical protein
MGMLFDAWSDGHHGNIHQAGPKAIEPSAVGDNGSDDPQNFTKPNQTVTFTNADRPSEKRTQKPARTSGTGGFYESGGDLSACDSGRSCSGVGHPFKCDIRGFHVE